MIIYSNEKPISEIQKEEKSLKDIQAQMSLAMAEVFEKQEKDKLEMMLAITELYEGEKKNG